MVTKDGVTVAREIELPDQLMNTGVRMIKQVATQTMDDAGDGTTTATVLAQSMIREGVRMLAVGASPINLKRGIDLAVESVVSELENLKILRPNDYHRTSLNFVPTGVLP
jgi:chaperonin GroEL